MYKNKYIVFFPFASLTLGLLQLNIWFSYEPATCTLLKNWLYFFVIKMVLVFIKRFLSRYNFFPKILLSAILPFFNVSMQTQVLSSFRKFLIYFECTQLKTFFYFTILYWRCGVFSNVLLRWGYKIFYRLIKPFPQPFNYWKKLNILNIYLLCIKLLYH